MTEPKLSQRGKAKMFEPGVPDDAVVPTAKPGEKAGNPAVDDVNEATKKPWWERNPETKALKEALDGKRLRGEITEEDYRRELHLLKKS